MKKVVKNVIPAATLNAKMNIYTRTGDKGETALFGGKRVSKASKIIETIGALDELQSVLGLIVSQKINTNLKKTLLLIEEDLYKIMAFLGGAKVDLSFLSERIGLFEKAIDEKKHITKEIKNFILPGKNSLSAWFNFARTVCRRAERQVVFLKKNLEKTSVLAYMNRLSDWLYLLTIIN